MPTPRASSSSTKRFPKKTPASDAGRTPSQLIDARIAELRDWRGELLARIRLLITSAVPGVSEEWKWNIPVWSSGGIICTGETYKKVVKLTFARGASLPDPAQLFNSSLEGSTRRAIDFPEGCQVDQVALTALVRAAVALNMSSPRGKARSAAPGGTVRGPTSDGA
jgi:hypothetical protein